MKIEVEQLFKQPNTAAPPSQRRDTVASKAAAESLFYEILADQTQWAVCGKQGAVINIQQSAK